VTNRDSGIKLIWEIIMKKLFNTIIVNFISENKILMKSVSLLLFFIITVNVRSQTIPSSRISDWYHTGYPTAIPSPSNIVDVTQHGATGDGITDDASAIAAAISSLNSSRGVIYFPPGHYLMRSTINLPDSVILRGASADSTFLVFDLSNSIANCINITGNVSATNTRIISGFERGSIAIVVDDPSTFLQGDYADVMQDNGVWDTDPVFWAEHSIGQIIHLNYISGDTLFFDSPFRIDFDTTLNARIQKITPVKEVGIECLNISRIDTISTGVCFNIWYNYAADCWMRGVESSISIGSHVEIDASTNISIRGSYFHHSYLYDGVSTHGYGITLFAHTGQCRIENNIMKHLRHSFSLQTGANGNVIAYNFSTDPYRSEIPNDAGADISLHGHFPFSNLFEGNIVQNIQIDYTHGPSGPFNTFFRNRADGYGLIMSTGSYPNDSMNFVGNEITNTAFLHGNFSLSGNANFNFGNNVKGTLTPSGTSPLPDSSYYLTGFPQFWTSTSFPSIGIPNIIATGSIPAKDHYIVGNTLTDCDDEITIGIEALIMDGIKFFPNPASEYINIEIAEVMSPFSISLKDLSGKILLKKTYSGFIKNYTLDFPKEIENGIYLLEINLKSKKIVKKIAINK
jgi:hypothetical protein